MLFRLVRIEDRRRRKRLQEHAVLDMDGFIHVLLGDAGVFDLLRSQELQGLAADRTPETKQRGSSRL